MAGISIAAIVADLTIEILTAGPRRPQDDKGGQRRKGGPSAGSGLNWPCRPDWLTAKMGLHCKG